jgi:hypothetical protein
VPELGHQAPAVNMSRATISLSRSASRLNSRSSFIRMATSRAETATLPDSSCSQ